MKSIALGDLTVSRVVEQVWPEPTPSQTLEHVCAHVKDGGKEAIMTAIGCAPRRNLPNRNGAAAFAPIPKPPPPHAAPSWDATVKTANSLWRPISQHQ